VTTTLSARGRQLMLTAQHLLLQLDEHDKISPHEVLL
jgi:hypothetical protein